MALRASHETGVAKQQELVTVGRFEGEGPGVVVAYNKGGANVVLRVEKEVDASHVALAEETAVTSENSGYTGNASTLVFTGQVLNNLPITPGTVTLTPATSGTNITDGGDGVFYTVDGDAEAAGTINYFTGAMSLSYPTGKAPDGQINAAYYYHDAELNPYSKRTYKVNNIPTNTAYTVKAACDDADGSQLWVDLAASWNA